jgi:hypothetical protein
LGLGDWPGGKCAALFCTAALGDGLVNPVPALLCVVGLFFYVGIFAVENGLGEKVGGIATSLANMFLLLPPFMQRWLRRHSVRSAIRVGCLGACVCFGGASILAFLGWSWATVCILVLGTCCLVLLDVSAGLPFLMAVKPSERTEMASVYSSFRDASGIFSPGMAWGVLQFFPLATVFAAVSALLWSGWLVAGHIHRELGVPEVKRLRGKTR